MRFLRHHIRELAAAILIAVFFAGIFLHSQAKKPDDISDIVWRAYTNAGYGFTIEYPSTWMVAAFPSNEIVPVFNFYDPQALDGEQPPLLNLSQATNVSVYPRGVPSGNDADAATAVSQTPVGVPTASKTDFLLAGGAVWATKAVPLARPPAWTRDGFLFARVSVPDFKTICEEDGKAVSQDLCKSGGAGTIAYSGAVSVRDRAIEAHMLASFHFTAGK